MSARDRINEKIKGRANKVRREKVDVPEWGLSGDDAIWVRAATNTERSQWEAGNVSISKSGKDRKLTMDDSRSRLIVACCQTEEGEALWTRADLDWLGGEDAAGIDRLFAVAARLSGIREVEDEEKNSPMTQQSSSCSPSAGTSASPTPSVSSAA